MATVTRNCEYCNAEFAAVRDHQRFCSNKHRVYASRYGAEFGGPSPAAKVARVGPADQTIAAALAAARAFTPVPIADHKTVAAIRVERPGPDPMSWSATIPKGSVNAAAQIHARLVDHAGDLITLANKLGERIGEPKHSVRTGARR